MIPELDAHGIDLMSARRGGPPGDPTSLVYVSSRLISDDAYVSAPTSILNLLLPQRMLQFDPAKRIHATEALKHPYFDTLDKTQARRRRGVTLAGKRHTQNEQVGCNLWE